MIVTQGVFQAATIVQDFMYYPLVKKAFKGAVNGDAVIGGRHFLFNIRVGKRMMLVEKKAKNGRTAGCCSKFVGF